MSQFAWIFEGGRPVDNYVINLAGVGDGFSVSNTVHRFTVPSGKRWLLKGGEIIPDASATISMILYNENDKKIADLGSATAGTDPINWPTNNPWIQGIPIIMKAGWYITITFGAAQSTTATATCIVLEIDAP